MLKQMLNLKLKNNATKALIRELEGGLPPDDPPPSGGGGGGIANPKDTPISGEGNNKPPKGNDGHMGKEGNGSGSGGETRPYVVIEKQEDKEVFIKNLDLSASATPIPASLDVEGFLKTLEGVKNHKRFIEHLAEKKDGQSRLAYLNLVEPTLKSPNIELVFNDPVRKKYIKAFKDEKGKTLKYLLITADNNETLITGLPVRQISYLQKQIRDADIIHSFIPPGRLANEQGALTPSGLPTAEFTTPELKNQASQWDLSNPKQSDVLNLGTLKNPELDTLKALFDAPNLERQIRAPELKNAMDNGFSLEEVLNYTSHLPTAKRTIFGDELHYSKPLENGKTLHISETYKEPHTLQFSHMHIVEDLKVPPSKIEPNPAFGEHFKEFEGKGAQAVAKLLKEQRGQVAGAFYREDLGYIDLVWGDSKKGLAHILERRTQQYGEQQALEFVNDLPRMLQEAKFWREIEDKIELVTPTDMIVLGKRGDNKFVLTSFRDRRSKDRFKELENPQTGDDVGFTGKSVSEPQTKDDVLLPNQTDSTTTPQT
ncbi:putative barnase/colicin E5 family endoribonuclease, partial [Helicobacter bizzozeronii]